MDKFEQVFARHHAVKSAYSSVYIRGCEWGFKAGQQSRQAEVDDLEMQKKILLDALYLKTDAVHFSQVIKALRGHDQYDEHRTKAEQQINNGARLTKHQINLSDSNQVSNSNLCEAEKLNRLG